MARSACRNVTGLGLAGPLPNNLTTFTALRSLDASNNQLSGPLPTAWGSDMGLQALESINLANNLIQGSNLLLIIWYALLKGRIWRFSGCMQQLLYVDRRA